MSKILRNIAIITLVAFAGVLIGCKRKDNEPEKPVITLSAEQTINYGSKIEVNVTNVENNQYTVVSDNPEVLNVDNLNEISAVGIGQATITVTAGDTTKTVTIEVKDQVTIKGNQQMTIGTRQQLSYTTLSGANFAGYTLTSDNEDVVKVLTNRQIEAVSLGKATLKVENDQLSTTIEIEVVDQYLFKYAKTMGINQSQSFEITLKSGQTVPDYTLTSLDESIVKVNGHEIEGVAVGTTKVIFTAGDYTTELEVSIISLSLDGVGEMTKNGLQILTLNVTPEEATVSGTYTSSDENVLVVVDGAKIRAVGVGEATITFESETGIQATFTIKVNEQYYNITYDMSDADKALMPDGFIEANSKFCASQLPLTLPILEKAKYNFLGWRINDVTDSEEIDESKLIFAIPETIKYDIILKPVWGVSRLELSYETTQIIEPTGTLQLIATTYMISHNIDATKITWRSHNEAIATVNSEGVVTGVSDGLAYIEASLTEYPSINMSIGVTVMSGLSEIDELLQYFIDNAIEEVLVKDAVVTGYQFVYPKRILGSVSNYLFKPFVVNEDYMIAANAENRPGDVYQKYYITVHDTASSATTADGLAHAKYVQNGGGGTSWHYSVGNDGVYHHIPDNERAYHAGDGRQPYEMYASGVSYIDGVTYPTVTISADGYYELNGAKTVISVPRKPSGEIPTNKEINDVGIEVTIKDGEYYIGKTWWSDTYQKVSNGGGNCNSIGMETAVNKGSDLYLTWQMTAQLVSHLLRDNNLILHDVKPHHFFSGKNCPQTMRDNNLWDNFLKLVQTEYDILTRFSDYTITFRSNDPDFVNEYGRVIKQDTYSKSVSYNITVAKDGYTKTITLSTVIPGTIRFRVVPE